MNFVMDILLEISKDTVYKLPTLAAVAILLGCVLFIRYLINRRYPVHIVMATAFVTIGVVILDFNILLYNSILLYSFAGLLICIPVVISIFKVFSIQRNLKKVKQLADSKNIHYNIVAAWKLLQSLSPKNMIPKRRKDYKRYRIFLLIKLGNISAVDVIIDAFKGDKAYYHLMQYIKYYSMGKITEAAKEIKSAEEVCTADSDPILYVQILTNRGVSHVCMMNYKLADDYFYKAAEYYKKYKIKDKELMETIYYNYAFNKASMGDDVWQEVLKEYKSFLDLKGLNDCISYFNIKMELLRQTGAKRVVIEKTVQESFLQIMKFKFSRGRKCIFVSSVVRMAWSARINPSEYLNALTENLETLKDLPMPARYNALKDIDLMFKDLHGGITEIHDELGKTANYYMINQAVDDLESYRKNLPEEAVLEKCFCYMEAAGLQKRFSRAYDSSKVLSYLKNAIALYHENFLFVDEHICRMAVMDELCGSENLDNDYKLANPEEMRNQLNAIETFLPYLVEHNVLAEFCLRLSFYCMHLDDYDKCVVYYNKFKKTRVSLKHFAPWLHRYHMITSFTVRAIYFMKAIEKAKESKKLVVYVSEVQEWFKTYPNHDGKLASMLLGQFFGYVRAIPLKQKTWIEPISNNGNSPRSHLWLWMDVFHLNIDITYTQYVGDKHQNCIFYQGDRHPLEANESYKIIADGMATGLLFKGAILMWFSKEDFPSEQKKIYDSIYSIITSHVDSECPTLERLAELHEDIMLPVAATKE